MNDLISRDLTDSLGGILVIQFSLGLSLKPGIRMLDGNDSRHSVSDISAGKICILFLEDTDLAGIIIDHLSEDGLKPCKMRSAFRIINIVAESQDVFVELIDKLKRGFYRDLITHSLEIDNVRDSFLGLIERTDKTDDPVGFMEHDLFSGLLPSVRIFYREFRVEIGSLMHAALNVFFPEPRLLKDLRVRQKVDPCAGPSGLANHRQQAVFKFHNGISPLIFILIKKTAAANADGHSFRKSVYHGRSHSVEASAGLVRIVIKFSSGVKCCKHHALRAHTFFMHSDRNASSVVLHCTGAVRLKDHLDRGAESGKMFIDGVVHDLIDQMIETPCGNAADIHAGPCPYSLKSLQHFDTGGVVIISILIQICHADFLFLVVLGCSRSDIFAQRDLLRAGDRERARADMAGDTQRKHIILHVERGESSSDFLGKLRELIRHIAMHSVKPDILFICSAIQSFYIMLHRVDHYILALVHGAGLGEGIESLTLDLQDRLNAKECAHSGCGRSDPAALLQIIESVEHDIDTGFILHMLQFFADLRGAHAHLRHFQRVKHGSLLCYRDPLVVDYLDLTVVVIREHSCALA